MVARTNSLGIILSVNKKFCDLSGYTEKELIGKGYRFLRSNIHSKNFYTGIRDKLSSGQVWQGDLCNRHKDGALYWINTTITPEPKPKTGEATFIIIGTDVTQAKFGSILNQAQQEATRAIISGQNLACALHNILAQLLPLDPTLKLSVCSLENGKTLRHLAAMGLPNTYSQAIDGLEIGPHVGACGSAAFLKEAVYANDIKTHPHWTKFKDLAAEFGLVSCWSLPIVDKEGKVFGTITIYSTERQKISEPLLAIQRATAQSMAGLFLIYEERSQYYDQNLKLNNLIQSSPYCIHEIDLEGRLLSMNASGLKMMSLSSEEEIKGIYYPDLPVKEQDRKNIAELFRTCLKGRYKKFEFEASNNGKSCYYSSCFVPLYNSDGNIYRVLGITEDVTTRRNNQKALIKAKEAAQKANNTKSTFLASMSHDLRTPLNAILGFSQIIETKIFGPLMEGKNEEYIKLVIASGKKMLLLVDDILDISKLESGDYNLSEEIFNANEWVRELTSEFTEIAHIYNVRVRLRLDNMNVMLKGEKKAIGQIFQNLTSNALKFSPHGAVIDISFQATESHTATLKVSDQGAGFTKKALDHLAEPFYSDDAYTTHKDKGTGLGLFISKRFAEMHSATISARNKESGGACVEVVFPSNRVNIIENQPETEKYNVRKPSPNVVHLHPTPQKRA